MRVLYDYECGSCFIQCEHFASPEDRDAPIECKQCGGTMWRVVSAPTVVIKPEDRAA